MAIGDVVSTLFNNSPAVPLPTLTPESVKRRRLLAEAMLKEGMDYSPIKSPWQGAARMVQGALGGWEAGMADRAEREGLAGARARAERLFGMEYGGATPAATSDAAPSDAAPSAPNRSLPTFAQDDPMFKYATAIHKNESGGDYGIVGPTHPKYGRALGAYQVMEANLPSWSKEAVGRVVSPDEFLQSKEIQDAVFKQQFGKSLDKYGNAQDAASVWFTGRPLAEGANRRDVLGTTGQRYVDKFSRALGTGTQVASADPSFVPQPQGLMAYAAPQAPGGGALPSMAGGMPQPMQMPPQAAVQPPQAPAPQQMAQAPQQAPQVPPDPTADAGNPIRPQAVQQVLQAASTPQVQQAAQAAVQTPQGRQIVQQAQGATLATIMAAMQNPWLNDGQRAVLMMVAREKMQESDPMRQLQMLRIKQELEGGSAAEREARALKLESDRFALENARRNAPLDTQAKEVGIEVQKRNLTKPLIDPTTAEREYAAAKAQGYTGTLMDFKTQLARAGASNTNVTVGGGSDKQIFDTMDAAAKEAQAAVSGLQAIREARKAVEGGAILGAGADARLALQKVGALLGVTNPEKIVNTETFRAAIAPQVAAMLKATVGTTQISNTDREFAEKAAGGSIALDQGSITRLMGIMEAAGRGRVDAYRKRLDTVYPEEGGKFARERALFGVPDVPADPSPVRVTSPAEARKLPKGTPIILPDGTPGVVR